jgi:hypothetical protein
MNNPWQFHIDDQWNWLGERKLYIRIRDWHTRQYSFVTAITTSEVKENEPRPGPLLTEGHENVADGLGGVTNFLQAALDCAWNAGMRPTGYKPEKNESEIAAVRYHLEDMRTLAIQRAPEWKPSI